MQIEEPSRPTNAGYWCGMSWGHNVFYSETSSLTIMLRVFNVTDDHQDSQTNPAAAPLEETLMLDVSYQFLRKDKAVLRYGAPYNPSYRGENVPNSFCDKYFENCDKKNCKVQSPNYPGMYPRNLTCYYHIRQTTVPDGKVALICIFQRNPHLIYIKDRNAPHLSKEQKLQVDSNCYILYDYLMVFDGNSSHSPVLATICKGETPLTGIISSGPDLLLLFHASTYDFPFQDSPRRQVFGFQLDVEVEFVDRESTAYVRDKSTCDYVVSSRGQRSGYIQSPVHSLLANTTCTWQLLAENTEVVWFYFLHYRHVRHPEIPTPGDCTNILTITDGNISLASTNVSIFMNNNERAEEENVTTATVVGKFCRPDHLPRVCSGVHAPGPHAASCFPGESYVSNSSGLTLSLTYTAGTAPGHVEFLARYEFVDKRQWGMATLGGGPCDRTFTQQPDRLFSSPRDVFLFGRGGAHKLHCVYTFKGEPHQKITLRILHSRMGSSCSTLYKQSSKRYECSHDGTQDKPTIWIREEPWEGVALSRACICNVSHEHPFLLVSYTNKVQIIFSIPVMTPASDYNDYFFEGEYSIVEAGTQPTKSLCDESWETLSGPHGNFTVGSSVTDCPSLPRLVTAADGSFLFLRVRGVTASETNCEGSARINVYAVGGWTPLASICPRVQQEQYSHVFSSGWHSPSQDKVDKSLWNNSGSMNIGQTNYYHHQQQQQQEQRGRRQGRQGWQQASRDLVVEYVGNTSETYMITWVGVWRPMQTAPLSPVGVDLCPHRCPQIQACLPADLWCDGSVHCPSGLDEGTTACGLLAALPWVYLGAGTVLSLSLVALLVAVVLHRRRLQDQQEESQSNTVAANNSHDHHKSTTQDLLLPSENSAW